MKKLLAVLLAALMLFAVVGCSSEPAANDGGDDQNVEGAQTGEELTKDNIKIGFSEPRSDGGSNAKLANILEYGKHGQPAKPFLKPAKSASRAECIRVMKQKLEEEVAKL